MNKKMLFGLLAISMMLMAPILPVYAGAADVSTWYHTMNGVLSDDYTLYPYENYNLNVGFSKFGEKINPFEDTTGVGLQYRGIPTNTLATSGADPFANPIVPKEEWVEGWWIMIYYKHSSLGWRIVWAYCLFGDTMAWGSPDDGDVLGSTTNPPARVTSDGWIRFPSKAPSGAIYTTAALNDPQSSIGWTPHGGRKTNGKCVTGDYQLVYDGPRRAIYSVSTDIYDQTIIAGAAAGGTITGEESALVNPIVTVNILIEFNKVKKEVIQKKDVKFHPDKLILSLATLPETISVQGTNIRTYPTTASGFNGRSFTNPLGQWNAAIKFSNRGEWDLGLAKAGYYKSFSHWYQNVVTAYNTDDEYHWIHRGAYYDKCQVIAAYTPFVGWTAYWPRVDWFTCDGFNLALSHGDITGRNDDDQADTSTEPAVPFIAGQWNFMLADLTPQFRGITTYGLTDQHDCNDDQASLTYPYPAVPGGTPGAADVLDKEVIFQNQEIFNPFDLYSAVHKQESRWLYKDDGTRPSAYSVQLTAGLDDHIYYAHYSTDYSNGLGLTAAAWTGYFVGMDYGGSYDGRVSTWVNKFTVGEDYVHSKNWALLLGSSATDQEMLKVTPIYGTPTTAAPLTLQVKDLVDFGFWLKSPATSTRTPRFEISIFQGADYTGTEHWIVGPQDNPHLTWFEMTRDYVESALGGFWLDGAGAQQPWSWFVANYGNYYVHCVGIVCDTEASNHRAAYVDDLTVAYTMGDSGVPYRRVYNMEEDKLVPSQWDGYCSFAERVEVANTLYTRIGVGSATPVAADFTNLGVTYGYKVIFWEASTVYPHEIKSKLYFWKYTGTPPTVTPWSVSTSANTLKVLYSTIEENEKGRYEWAIVGTLGASVDSIGAAYLTEAFDSIKDIHVDKTGLDMEESSFGLKVPYVMTGTGRLQSGYKDSLGRVKLQDDFCGSNAIDTSNIIWVGGPEANLGAYYLNDFGPLFYGNGYAGTAYSGKIVKHECWSRNTYSSNDAVIMVYKDIHGTVHFAVWGLSGQDTYFACMWLWKSGIYAWWDMNNDGLKTSNEKFYVPGIVWLQTVNRGVVAINLHFDYTVKYNSATSPFIKITEVLGTISEKYPHLDP